MSDLSAPDPKIEEAKGVLDPKVPFVTTENWEQILSEGWRLEDNHIPNRLKGMVEFYQDQCGKENVTLGWRFSSKLDHRPVESDFFTAIYIRDVELQADVLKEMLADDEFVADVLDSWALALRRKGK